MLEEKRRVLFRRREELAREAAEARAEWERLAAEASELRRQALVLAGARRFRILAFYGGGKAEVRVRWRNVLGVTVPEEAELGLPEPVDLVPLGATLPLALAAGAYRRALAAGAQYARLREAHRRVSDEAMRTARRLRAIEHRWIPQHERALLERELALDELEREDSGRARWFRERPRTTGPP